MSDVVETVCGYCFKARDAEADCTCPQSIYNNKVVVLEQQLAEAQGQIDSMTLHIGVMEDHADSQSKSAHEHADKLRKHIIQLETELKAAQKRIEELQKKL